MGRWCFDGHDRIRWFFESAGAGSAVAVEFHEVVASSEELPFVGGFLDSVQQEVFSLAGADLPEHGLHDGFAPGVNLLATLGLQHFNFLPSVLPRLPWWGSGLNGGDPASTLGHTAVSLCLRRGPIKPGQIQFIVDECGNDLGQVILRQPFIQRWRAQHHSIRFKSREAFVRPTVGICPIITDKLSCGFSPPK